MNLRNDTFEHLAHTTSLVFPPGIEAQFRDDYFHRSLVANRVGCFAGLTVMAAFGLLDTWAAPNSYPLFWLLRYGVACPLILLCAVLTFFRPYRRFMQPLTAFAAGSAMLSIVVMILVADGAEIASRLYVFGLTPVMVFIYTVVRLRFVYAVAAVNIGILAYAAALLLCPGMLATRDDRMYFITNMCFILAVDVAGMISCYIHEIAFRRFFIIRCMIDQERRISDSLLLNILPVSIADRLKKHEKVVDQFDHAGILFADIAGFTPISSRTTPQQIVALLNDVFTRFDRLVARYGLEKIKTIGDAYMVVSGLPQSRPDYAEALVDLALEMQEAVKGLTDLDGKPLQIRIGVNTGPVIAGVIGTHKFIYDLWGDAVNIASRMESQGICGGIQITENTYELVRERYDCMFRAKILVKGKGPMKVYLVMGRKKLYQTAGEGRREGSPA